MAYNTVTVTTTATLIRAANTDRVEFRICNTENATIVYIGQDSSVTTANGFPIYENQSFIQQKNQGMWLGDVYGIVSAGTADVRYWTGEGS